MNPETDLVARLYLFAVAALLGLASAYVFFKFGLGWGCGLLGGLTALAFWGCVSTSPRLRSLVSTIFPETASDFPQAMKDLSALLPTLVTLAFLTQLGMALMALGRMLYLGWRTGNEAAFSFLRQASIAGLPCLAALLAFLWVFMTADPLWPAQDAPPEIEAAYRIARENADHYYRLAGVANLVACLWSLSLLRKAWRQTSNMPARGNAGDA